MLSRMTRLLALAIAWALIGLAPAQAQWLRAESPHFVVYGQGSEAQLRQRVLLLEDYHQLLRLLTSARAEASPNKLHVYIVRGQDQLSTPRRVGSIVAGYYVASGSGTAAFSDERSQGNATEILLHEYAHHFMLQYFPSAYPGWYVEGFAEYLMTARFNDRHIEFGRFSTDRAGWLADGTWLPMHKVLGSDQRGLSSEDVARFYAQSWLIVHYFFHDPARMAALQRYLAAFARGEDSIQAFARETGFTPEQLQRELQRYARSRITFKRMARSSDVTPPSVTVTRLPRSADQLLLLQAGLRIGVPAGAEADYLQRVRTAAARHSGDGFANRVRAHAEALHGDSVVAESLLADLLAAAPRDAELLYLRGMRHMREAETADDPLPHQRAAREWFARAHQADENLVPALYNYALSLRGEPDFVSENTTNILLLARQLAPQASEITFLAAQMLMWRDMLPQAAALLAPLAADVHGNSAAAREMLEQVRARIDGQRSDEGSEVKAAVEG